MTVEVEDDAPNNNFCFTKSDFLLYFNGMNAVTLHQNKHKVVWKKIKAMKGDEIKVESSVDAKVI